MNTPFEKRVCLTICICQLTAVLSCVSIVYLTVAVYVPSYRSLNSGFSEEPVMCTTVTNSSIPNCEVDNQPSWSSCGEWCLSKSSGSCTQIRVDVRQNGSNIRLEDCEAEEVMYCDGIDPKKPSSECILGDCAGLTGLFNCSVESSANPDAAQGARCRNLTSVLACNVTSLDPEVYCYNKKACLDLRGLYQCTVGHCARIRPPFKCEKKCTGIKTGGKSVIIREGDIIFTASCKRAVSMETNEEIWPKDAKSVDFPDEPPVLLMFCTNVIDRQKNKTTIRLSDCFNATLVEPGFFPELSDIMSLTNAHHQNRRNLDPTGLYGPPESNLVIYNNTPLYINYDACVNTLILNECEKFHAEYGGDGSDLRSQSRFQCYYRPNFTDSPDNPNFVVLRFSHMRALMELMIASVVPITLAVVSCFVLLLCTRIIHVGDDSHFYFQCCGNDQQAALEKEAVEAMAL